MKLNFNYFVPTRILFGAGKLNQLANTRYLTGKKALIVISADLVMEKYGYLDRPLAICRVPVCNRLFSIKSLLILLLNM